MKKTLIFCGIILLLFAATVRAELQLTEPVHRETVQLNVVEGETAKIEISIWNKGGLPVQDITPTTDLNAKFDMVGFGIDANKTKTVTLTLKPEQTTKGTVWIGAEYFHLKINVLQQKIAVEDLAKRLKEEEITVFGVTFSLITILVILFLAVVVLGNALVAKAGGKAGENALIVSLLGATILIMTILLMLL